MDIVTQDLSRFGYRELDMAADLLKKFANGRAPDDFDAEGLTLNFNLNSGCVFLSNENYEVAMMNGDKLESFYTCGECGHEGFKEEMKHEGNASCNDYLYFIGVNETPTASEN